MSAPYCKPYHHILITLLLLGTASISHGGPIGHAPWVGYTLEGAPCKGGSENFGPFDYLLRSQLQGELGIVERHHFTPEVEQLIKGHTSLSPLGDLGYTLKAWPNHHRALYSVIQYRASSWPSPHPARYPPAECYLKRAIKFSPKDATTRMLYGILLQRTGHMADALTAYETALKLDPDNVQIKYNLALLLVDLEKFSEARTYANELYGRGFPLPGLKNKLKAAGQWP